MTTDLTTQIIAYEEGDASEEEAIALFQRLVDSGQAWSLQGHYGRTAMALIEAGLVTHPTQRAAADEADRIVREDS